MDTYALIDSGSAITLITPEITEQLQLVGTPRPLVIQWTDKTRRTINDSKTVSLQIGARKPGQLMYSIVARTMQMHLPTQSITIGGLRRLGLLDLPIATYDSARPQILIGLDNIIVTAPNQSQRHDTIVAHQTPIGWTIEGYMRTHQPADVPATVQSISLSGIQDIVSRFIESETLGIDPKRPLLESTETMKAREQLKQNTKKTERGYEVGLLWKSNKRPGPCNRWYALKRLQGFEQKMDSDPEIRLAAEKTMKNYIERGYVSRVTAITCGDAWYLPIFAVKTSQKTRLVWDAAAKANDTCLNEHLSKGPDMNEPLWNILLRFREHQFAFSADVSEMFHQIQVPESDRRFQRFLWRDAKTGEIEDYEMDVQTFGAACSPAVAQHVKNENARRYLTEYPKAAEAIIRNTYVDDLLQSCANEDEAVSLAQQITDIQKEANFTLHKWTSNSELVQGSFGNHQRTERELQKDPKTLGLKWRTKTDELSFDLKLVTTNEAKGILPTKRIVLSFVMSLFDPLGLAIPQATVGRLIVRDLWIVDLNWDENIPEEIRRRWIEWMEKLQSLQNLKIPRWYGLSSPKKELHIFVDASEKAMAAVAYFRGETASGIKVSLVAAKSKLAPTSQQSIPRLELQAAVLGLRLAEMIRETTSTRPTKIIFWTDAQNTLWWINSNKRRYRIYVALRVAEILSLTNARDWRWVPGTMNPADIATKPHDWDSPSKRELWFEGPPFLKQPEEKWPETTLREPAENYEVVKVMKISAVDPEFSAVADPARVSSWNRMLRVTAYAQRFLEGARRGRGSLTAEELEKAATELHREAQKTFNEEIKMVLEGKRHDLPKKGELSRADLFVDSQRILRFRSRNLHAAELTYDAKFPIVLPRNHTITERIVEHYHKVHLHENTQTVLNELRQKYFIGHTRSTVNRIVRRCQKCALDRAKPLQPQMANHPKDRMAAGRKPFHSTGVDYFGPMTTTIGRRKEKRWGVVFTCLTTRAIHLEMAYSLSGESCKKCIENFIGRRGTPEVVWSDNGTNFVWAANNVRGPLGTAIRWKFIPPGAPAQGGAWERLVGSVKRALAQMEMPSSLTDEQLQNFLIKAERLINARPLTEIPVHPDQPALTPNHFLLGSSTGGKQGSGEPREDNDEINQAYDQLLGEREEQRTMLRHFWKRWHKEYLPLIAARTKWNRPTQALEVDDLVFVCEPGGWKRGRVKEAMIDPETQQVREVIVTTAHREYRRPATKVAKIRIMNEETSTWKRKTSDAGPITRSKTQKFSRTTA